MLFSNFHAGTDVQQADSEPPANIVAAGLNWVPSNTGGSFVPPGSVVAGYRFNGDPVYVVRVLAPDGKYHPAKSGSGYDCHYAYNDEEQTTTTCDFLVVSDEDVIILEWVATEGANVPTYAVGGERNEYYICRHDVSGELVSGELDTEYGICTVVSRWSTREYTEYEALCAIPHAPLF